MLNRLNKKRVKVCLPLALFLINTKFKIQAKASKVKRAPIFFKVKTALKSSKYTNVLKLIKKILKISRGIKKLSGFDFLKKLVSIVNN